MVASIKNTIQINLTRQEVLAKTAALLPQAKAAISSLVDTKKHRYFVTKNGAHALFPRLWREENSNAKRVLRVGVSAFTTKTKAKCFKFMHASEVLSAYQSGRRDFSHCKIVGTLRDKHLAGTNLSNSDFSECELEGVNLSYATLDSETKFPKNLKRIKFMHCNLQGRDLRNHEIDGASLYSVLVNAETKLPKNLRGVCFFRYNFCDADLSEHDLNDADLSCVLINSNTKFPPSKMRRVKLEKVDLQGLQFNQHDLAGANIKGAKIDEQSIFKEGLARLIATSDGCLEVAGLSNPLPNESLVSFAYIIQAPREDYHKYVFLKFRQRMNGTNDIEVISQQHKQIYTKYFSESFLLAQSVCSELIFSLPIGEDSSNSRVNKLRMNAIAIARIMDGNEESSFRKTIHNDPSPQVIKLIEDKIAEAKLKFLGDTVLMENLQECLTIAHELYSNKLNITEVQSDMSDELRHALTWPIDTENVTLAEASKLAREIRKIWDESSKIVTNGADRLSLVRLSLGLQQFAFGNCAYVEIEKNTAMQARKMVMLIDALYGCGYGDASWIALADRLRDLAQQWTASEADRRLLAEYGALSHEIFCTVSDSHHEHLDEAHHNLSSVLNFTPEEEGNATANQIRQTAAFILDAHAKGLKATSGSRKVAQKVFKVMTEPTPDLSVTTASFYHDKEYSKSLRVSGGKGLSLRWLAQRVPNKVSIGFTLSPKSPDFKLDKVLKDLIKARVAEIVARKNIQLIAEGKSAVKFGNGPDDLKVSVRSGGPVSMPGTMQTKLNVDTLDEVYAYVEQVYSSWNSRAARAYRLANGIPDDFYTSVTIEEMVNGQFNDKSGAGNVFSAAGDRLKIEYKRKATGEVVVSGSKKADDLLDSEIENEMEIDVRGFENVRKTPLELEFTVQNGILKYLQIREANLAYHDAIDWYAKKVRDGILTKDEAILALGGNQELIRAKKQTVLQLSGAEIILYKPRSNKKRTGSGAPYTGLVATNEEQIAEIMHSGAQAVFVSISPDAYEAGANAIKAGAVITLRAGNESSHLASVVRSMNLSYLAGVPIKIGKQSITLRNIEIANAAEVTIDPKTGIIYQGNVPKMTKDSSQTENIEFLLAN